MAGSACPAAPFRSAGRFKHRLAYTPPASGLHCARHAVATTSYMSSVSHNGPSNMPAKSESPFAFSGCYPSKGDVYHHLSGRYAPVVAPTGSCASSIALPQQLRFYTRLWVLAGCCRPRLGTDPSRPYLCKSFPGCLAPYPGCLPKCSCSFLPLDPRPSLSLKQVGFQLHPAQRLQCGLAFRGCRHSLMFRPPGLLATLVAPTTTVRHRRAAVTFTSGHRAVSLVPHSGYATRLNRATDGRGLSPPRSAALSAAPQTSSIPPAELGVYLTDLLLGAGEHQNGDPARQ